MWLLREKVRRCEASRSRLELEEDRLRLCAERNGVIPIQRPGVCRAADRARSFHGMSSVMEERRQLRKARRGRRSGVSVCGLRPWHARRGLDRWSPQTGMPCRPDWPSRPIGVAWNRRGMAGRELRVAPEHAGAVGSQPFRNGLAKICPDAAIGAAETVDSHDHLQGDIVEVRQGGCGGAIGKRR